MTMDAQKNMANGKGNPIHSFPDLPIITLITFGPIIYDAQLDRPFIKKCTKRVNMLAHHVIESGWGKFNHY